MPGKKEKTSSASFKMRAKKKWTKEAVIGLIIILIPLIGYLIFSGFPLIVSFITQFTSMDGYDLSSMQWNNFANFQLIFTDTRFYKSIGITAWLASAQIVSLVIALAISVLLRAKVKGSKLFTILFFIPYICSSVAVAQMWKWIMDADHGLLNALLGTHINWLSNVNDPQTLTWAIFLAIIWQSPGYGIVMYRSALVAVPSTLYEAASLDGANAWDKFVHITLPSVAPTTFYLLFTGILSGLMTFEAATLMAPVTWQQTAGYEDMGLTLLYYAYIQGTQRFNMGAACVISWFLFLVTALVSIPVLKKRSAGSEL